MSFSQGKPVRVRLWQEDHWYIAQCADVELASQGGSADEALINIKEALALHFEEPVGASVSAALPALPALPATPISDVTFVEIQLGD